MSEERGRGGPRETRTEREDTEQARQEIGIVSGFRAVLVLWTRIPEYRWLARVFSWPPLRALCEALYDHVVAPGLAHWARMRHPGVRT